ncbi:hypothetical protein BXO87_01915 [Bacillus sp. GZB]|uniref:hypothetical protein n=1 Tax=Bacillus TaxID=1386 RepID=UPI00097713AC|nr:MULTISPECIES: hypothetical protein [Bacillus]MCZ4246883.1 hypothetical protein [Bacillus amyloliquefaciens]OMQ06786.1 hypothetical protein BXO87_01915 [Bacillus sp. GZB]
MSMPALTEGTISRISVESAPLPGPHPDPNIGKRAKPLNGVYSSLTGIIYPSTENYSNATTHLKGSKDYLLMFFYDDGSLFCAIEADIGDMSVLDGTQPVPEGEGTPAAPFGCNLQVADNSIKGLGDGSYVIYHELPNQIGDVVVTYDFLNEPDSMSIYWSGEEETPVASTNGKVSKTGSLSFYYDPAYNPTKVVVKVNQEGAKSNSTAWKYKMSCPKSRK